MVLLISLLAAFLIFAVLYYIIKTKIVPDNQVHQRLRDLQGTEGRVITSHADELARFLSWIVLLYRSYESLKILWYALLLPVFTIR